MDYLFFKHATMNSGKTLDLIIRAYSYEETGNKVLVMKPKIDTKGNNKIISRAGFERDVDVLIGRNDSIIELLANKLTNVKLILVDEAQFLSIEQIDELQIISHATKIQTICYGLRTDFKNELFEGSKRLFEIADKRIEQASICMCGKEAKFVSRKVNGEYVSNGETIVIDGTSNVEYEPMCADCYNQKVKRIDYEKIKKKVI